MSLIHSESAKNFIAGTMAGFSARIIEHPFDTVKVMLQTQSTAVSGKTYYRGAIHCLIDTFQNKGIRGLYKGLSSPLLGTMAENAVLFWAYGNIKRALGETPENELSLLYLALAGGSAGAFTPLVNTPVELVKCRLQVQNSSSGNFRRYSGPIDVIIQTIKREGIIKGLYKGNTATLLRETPGNFVWYGLYEGTCKYMTPVGGSKKDLGLSVHLLGGAISGIGYWTAFYPADTVKSLIQTSPEYAKKSFVEALALVYRNQGVQGLYRGWGVTVTRAAPAHAIIFAVYEYTMKSLKSLS